MAKQRRLAFLVGGLALMATLAGLQAAQAETDGAAQVQPASTPINLYQQYTAALDRADMDEATRLAVEAWTVAQAQWPDTNPNKAGLAYNAAWSLTMTGRADEALEAARAAVRMGPTPAVDADSAAFLLAVAELAVAPRGELNRLARALVPLADRVLAQTDLDLVVPIALSSSAWVLIRNNRYDHLNEIAARAITGLERIGQTSGTLVGEAYLARSVSMFDGERTETKTRNALRDVRAAIRAFGEPGADAPPAYYASLAWRAAVRGVGLSNYPQVRDWDEQQEDELVPRARDCRFSRVPGTGQGITFPNTLVREGVAGGALVLATLTPDGRVAAARVASSIPDPEFGEAARNAVATWRYQIPEGSDPSCLTDFKVIVTYAFR